MLNNNLNISANCNNNKLTYNMASDSSKVAEHGDQETKLLMDNQVRMFETDQWSKKHLYSVIQVLIGDVELSNNKVHFHTDKEKDDVSLYGTPKEEVGTVNTSRYAISFVVCKDVTWSLISEIQSQVNPNLAGWEIIFKIFLLPRTTNLRWNCLAQKKLWWRKEFVWNPQDTGSFIHVLVSGRKKLFNF